MLFSGIQPNGNLHLGNYLGAIKNWVELQCKFDSLMFCVVDLHAITVPHSPKILNESILKTAATYIACGIDIEKSIIFTQSSVSEHSELAWILNCITPIGWLNRMTQFKDKTAQDKSLASLGLYSYPVLMAADILLYKTTHVPVGKDQAQHVELANDIAGAFNSRYKINYFSAIQTIYSKGNPRVMSLRNGKNKMSKSDPSDYSRINLCDTADLIAKKMAKAKSDSILGFNPETLHVRPEANNLIKIYCSLNEVTVDAACNEFKNFTDLKNKLTDLLIFSLKKIREKVDDLIEDKGFIANILEKGKFQAKSQALLNLSEIKKIMGLYN